MSVVIRMKRIGRRNHPTYRIAVADSRRPVDGRVLASLGFYDPVSSVPDLRLKLDVEKARHWLGAGALPSETVASIFRRLGVYEGLPVKKKRVRTGRSQDTANAKRRAATKETRTTRKAERSKAKVSAKRAAKAAPAAT